MDIIETEEEVEIQYMIFSHNDYTRSNYIHLTVLLVLRHSFHLGLKVCEVSIDELDVRLYIEGASEEVAAKIDFQ